MSSNNGSELMTVLATCTALIDQFQTSLAGSFASEQPLTGSAEDHPSPLLLFKAAAETVKSSTTKLSLLSITPPFTESAVASVVKPLNNSVLPSLVTASLLVTPAKYPESFAQEARRLARYTLTELKSLIELIQARAADGKPKSEPSKQEKQGLTEATGKVWEACDVTIAFAENDVPGFVVKKTEQWLALMKDAVQELQEWDPEEDVDDIFADTTSDDGTDSKFTDKEGDPHQAVIAAGVKEQALKVLSRIPQSIHVVIKQRLAKIPPNLIDRNGNDNPNTKRLLEKTISNTRQISELIDESAEAMYMGDPELCLKKAGEARALTISVVQSVLQPWLPAVGDTKETKEDTFIKRALVWISQVDMPTTAHAQKADGKSG